MSNRSRVVWTDGMFLRPQHFQQHDRGLDSVIDSRVQAVSSYAWGFSSLQINTELLPSGKVGLLRAHGVFSDGTTIRVPDDDESPSALEIPSSAAGDIVYLCIPERGEGACEFEDVHGLVSTTDSLARFSSRSIEIRDNSDSDGDVAPVKIAQPKLSIKLEREDRSAYSCLSIARVEGVRSDGTVILDQDFIPPCTDAVVATRLHGFIGEFTGLLTHRAQKLVERLHGGGNIAVAEVTDFILLQLVNRLRAEYTHYTNLIGLHPERLYCNLVSAASELATFTSQDRMAPEFPRYQHDDLLNCFQPVLNNLRQSLSSVLEQNVVALRLEERQYGIRVAPIADPDLIQNSVFVLAVTADTAPEKVIQHFPSQTKLGAVEKIRDLVNLQLPGIALKPLPVAPRQIPFSAGFTYFELDKSGPEFQQLLESSGLAMHVAGNYPNIQLQLWAIRR